MTLKEILTKYNCMKSDARRFNDWKKLDDFVEELAQVASGTPLLVDSSEDFVLHESKPC